MGKKRLEGRTGLLRIQGNGGVAPLVIDHPGYIPDEYCVWEGRISFAAYKLIATMILTDPVTRLERVPNNSLIRAALGEECPRCKGDGIAEADDGRTGYVCPECGGAGSKGVQGARLGERGVALHVK
jgi:hypothetical protein